MQAITTKDGPSVKEESGKFKLYTKTVKQRFCLKGQPPPPEPSSLGGGSSDEAKAYEKLRTAALGLRCGATTAERDAMKKVMEPQQSRSERKPGDGSQPDNDNELVERASFSLLNAATECRRHVLPLIDNLAGSNSMDDAKTKQKMAKKESYLYRYCELLEDIKSIARLHFPEDREDQPVSVKIIIRTTDDVVAYLGRVAAWYYQMCDPRREKENPYCGVVWVPEYPDYDDDASGLSDLHDCPPFRIDEKNPRIDEKNPRKVDLHFQGCYPLLVVQKNASEPAFVSVSYGPTKDTYAKDTYSVPNSDESKTSGNSFAVFELVHQLLALEKVAKDLPPTSIITVSPSP